MKINQLRCFVQVADKGSVRAAAETLEVSPTAVSQALRELERAVGASLFMRQAQGVALTYIGQQLLIHARLILGQVERAEEEISRLQGLNGSAISIGVTPWVSQSILPHALRAFRQIQPDVRLDIYEALGNAHNALREGVLDFVIGMPPQQQLAPSFVSRELFSCGLAVVARVGHPLADCTSLRELDGQSWILTLRQEADSRPLFDLLAPHGIAPPPSRLHFARSTLISLAMLEGGDMLTVCPWPLVESPLLRNRIQALPIRDPLPELRTGIVMRRTDTLPAAGQLFIDTFLEASRACLYSTDPALKRILNSVEFIDRAT